MLKRKKKEKHWQLDRTGGWDHHGSPEMEKKHANFQQKVMGLVCKP